MKILIIILLQFISILAYGLNTPIATIDIYGTNSLSAEKIFTEYKKEINEIAKAARQGTTAAEAMKKIITGIKSQGNFAYVNLSPILYQHDPITHITVDVVENKDRHRLLYFQAVPKQDIPDQDHLIIKWQEYEKLGFEIVYRTHQFPDFKKCPAHHCLFGFEQEKLKKYESIFSEAEKHKTNLINIMRFDKDAHKRGAAVFVLAHIKNPHELIEILLPAIHDSSALVRNNAMRVLGATLANNKSNHLPLDKIMTALDYPTTTDRNKALFIILSMATDINAPYIKMHAGQRLLSILKLQQPNNHDFAYLILKKISRKNYDEHDFTAWEKWLA